ncbi:MerR family transcriptional regulator [Shewanella cyperi]|uniref:MerR family transcriptional regulator n=1 Tax=Shewanella cyperi TaxID=2814292 RepID=UPI001A94C4B5|nr:MerR family transcriptional regulator [Shewanella cyperi]QSX40086.1 MerR family transcriptional regulator [Shewanella cyperi]
MAQYNVSELARLAGVSVRTLHHYDEIGLLPPSGRTLGGYRLYGERDLLRLQQILMYRELGLKLARIRDIMTDPQHDLLTSLKEQYSQLGQHIAHFQRLRRMLDLAIVQLEQRKESDMTTTPGKLFADFSEAALKDEAIDKWGQDAVNRGGAGREAMDSEGKAALDAEGEAISKELATLVGQAADSDAVQALMARQHAWLCAHGDCPAARLPMLGEMYVADERFRHFYDRFASGTAELMRDGLVHYAAKLT